MRIKVKGIHWTSAKLADGTKVIYHYAYKGGPRIRGEYGTADFIASYNEAIAQREPTAEGRLQSLIHGYQRSQKFLGRSQRTREDYIRQIKIIEKEFSDFPLRALTARETRGVFMPSNLPLRRLSAMELLIVENCPRSDPSPACATVFAHAGRR